MQLGRERTFSRFQPKLQAPTANNRRTKKEGRRKEEEELHQTVLQKTNSSHEQAPHLILIKTKRISATEEKDRTR